MSIESPDWRYDGACRDTDPGLFFGPDGENARTQTAREAKAISVCGGCPVRAACLGWHLTFRTQHGVAGGMGEEERKVLRHSLLRRYPDGVFPVFAVTKALAAKDHLKVCTGPCGRALPAAQFSKRGAGYRRTECRDCWTGIVKQRAREASAAIAGLEVAS